MTKLTMTQQCAVDMRYLRLMAERKEIPWKSWDLPQELKDKCIAYCIREGDTYRIGRPSRNAVIFIFPDGTVYDIPLLVWAGYCWRTISSESLKWIKEKTP